METRIDELLAEMTPEEKCHFVAGSGMWHTTPIERLGIPRMKVSDGPIGVRGEQFAGRVSSACFPNASCLAASFDPSLVQEVGQALGQEAHSKGVHVVLGPTVNLHRSPLGGRHFECYSEDPFLTAQLCVAFVRGVQSEGVGTSVKHFVCNDSEFERMSISSEVSERALREIYLQPFEAAVRDAKPWTVMASYNRINGTFAADHRALQVDVLKREWGFDGLIVSDWFALKSTEGPAAGGLDLEMPGPPRFFGAKLAEALGKDAALEREIDDKVRRILRVMIWTGALDAEEAPAEEARDLPEHRALARRAATCGAVLLKNDGPVLPLDTGKLRRIALIGPNAEHTSVLGGGSARVLPHYEVSVLDAFRERADEAGFDLVHALGCTNHKQTPVIPSSDVASGVAGRSGFATDYFAGTDLAGTPVNSRVTRTLDRTWFGRFLPDLDPSDFSVRFQGAFTPRETGDYTFALVSAGLSRLFVDDALVVDNWTSQEKGDAWFGAGSKEKTAQVTLTEGKAVNVRIEYASKGTGGPLGNMGGLRVGLLPPIPSDLMERAEAAARDADAAVVVVGLSAEWETEGHDKDHMQLPGRQAELCQRVAAANPNTVVVLNAGGPTDLAFADDVPALLQAWYGGQEAGHAVADVLFGDSDPGGRLPTTFPRAIEDVPCHTDDPSTYPGEEGRVVYAEDLLIGHRHYDAHDIAPRFPFGHGLSYTTFAYGAIACPERVAQGESVEVVVPVRNTGDRPGREVVQLYLSDLESSQPRPPRELKAFAAVDLAPGEEKRVTLTLSPRDLSFWDPERGAFVAEAGVFEAQVGRSAGDLRAHARFTLEDA